ncbi:11929_t:CDS:2, partial [Ambispora leptoticha]
ELHERLELGSILYSSYSSHVIPVSLFWSIYVSLGPVLYFGPVRSFLVDLHVPPGHLPGYMNISN